MRQERFTEQAQEALAASQQLVRQYKHNQWDAEHILLALLQQEKGLVGDILKELGADVESLRNQVSAVLEKAGRYTPRRASPSCWRRPPVKPTALKTNSSAPSTC